MMLWPTICIGVLSELNRSKHWRVSIQYAHACNTNFDLHINTLACNSSRGLNEARLPVAFDECVRKCVGAGVSVTELSAQD